MSKAESAGKARRYYTLDAGRPIGCAALPGLLTAVVLGAALHVDKGLDAGLPCAANAALEQAIKVRLPRVRVARGRLGVDDLSAAITAAGGGFRFEVRRADGSVAMSRDLFSGCPQLGDTSALILERYLAQISWAGRDVGLVAPSPPVPPKPKPAPLPPPPVVVVEAVDAGEPESADLIARIGVAPEPSGEEPISAPQVARDAGAPVINLPPPPPPREPIVTAVEVSAGGGVWYGNALVAAFSLDVGVMLRERVRVGVLGLVGLPQSHDVLPKTGSVQSFDFGAFGMLGVCTKTAVRFCGNAFGGMRLTWAAASTSSDKARLFRTATGVISVPELGLLARVSYAVSRLIVALDLISGVPLQRGAILVEGLDPFWNPYIDLTAQLRLGAKF